MSNYDLITEGNTVDFSVYAPEKLTTGWKNSVVLGTFDMSTAQALGLDVQAKHRAVYPDIKANGVANDPNSYKYARIKKPSGEIHILGIPWIMAATITVVNRDNIIVRISDVGTNDLVKVKAALTSNGYPQAVVAMAD